MPNGDILIVDDASFMRQMIREIVEPEGYEVVGEAANGIDGVNMFRELRPDLVTMDVVMPKCSGIDAVKGILLIEPEAAHYNVFSTWAGNCCDGGTSSRRF